MESPSGESNPNMDLIQAASELDLDRVNALLAAGADAGFMHAPPGTWGSSDSKTALHAAIEAQKGDSTAVVFALLDAGADVNAKRNCYDWRGCGSTSSAFEMALPAAMKDVRLLERLLAAGGDPNTTSVREVHSMRTDGQTEKSVLHTAVETESLELARALLDAGANVDALHTEVMDNERGFNEDMEQTALHVSICAGDVAMAALLIARGAEVNSWRKCLDQRDSGERGDTDDPRDDGFVSSVVCVPIRETALHLALRKKHEGLVTLLACAGADASLVREDGEERQTCEEMCGEDEKLLKAVRAEWTPETHHLFPTDVRSSVEAALMIARRQDWPLPSNLLFDICALAVSPGDPMLAGGAQS